jgi:hypothetical protein
MQEIDGVFDSRSDGKLELQNGELALAKIAAPSGGVQ